MLSQGDVLFYAGIALAGIGSAALLIGNIVYSAKKRKLNDTLRDRYGF